VPKDTLASVRAVQVWVPKKTRLEHLALLPSGIEVCMLPAPGPLADVLGSAEILIPPFHRAFTWEVIPRLRGLRVIQALSAGVDWLLPAVPDGVILCDAAGVHDIAVAEWVLAVILAMVRDLPRHLDNQRAGLWARPDERTGELSGSTVLIVGYGSIGRATERRLVPFGVNLVRVARRRRRGVHGADELADLITEADIVVVLLPLTEATRGLLGGELIARMRPGALLVNAARGAVVDTAALTEAVLTGRIRAALDVVDPEPLPAGHPLWRAPGVLITPHVAGSTSRFPERAWRFAGEQLRRYLAGEPLRNVVRRGY
jgi:phosphoglycerate dehydrogenase-like enzyme